MEHSKNFGIIKTYYDNCMKGKEPRWNINMVSGAVGREAGITEAEYKEITGYTYPDRG